MLAAALGAAACCAVIACVWWRASANPGAPVDLSKGPRELCYEASEQREGWHIQRPVRINCGPPPDSGALRLGFFHEGNPRGWFARRAAFEVRVGKTTVAHERLDDAPEWCDYRFQLPGDAEGDCTVTLRPSRGFLLSHCEVFASQADAPAAFIFLIDALRLDHMSCYGYERETTPHISAFAKDAVRFTQLMPSSSWTRPSVASLLTGLYPEVHGGQDRPDILREGLPSLAGSLKKAGFETLGFISNPNCLPEWGFGEGFRRYIDVNSYQWGTALDEDVINRVLECLPLVEGRPCFAYIHTMAPHDPYNPPKPYDELFPAPEVPPVSDEDASRSKKLSEEQRIVLKRYVEIAAKHTRLYDGEIAYVDAQFERFLAALKEAGRYEQALIIVLSDHGEGLMTHGLGGHGNSLYEELLRVPLLVKLPGNAHGGETREELVEMVDVAPTVLELLGLSPEPEFAGDSFAALTRGAGGGKAMGYASLRLGDYDWRTAKTTDLKYVRSNNEGWQRWYDLARDPLEREPIEPPVEPHPPLAAHAAESERHSLAGLHILVIPSPDRDLEITGTVAGDGVTLLPSASAPDALELDVDAHAFQFRLLRERSQGRDKRAIARLRASVTPDAIPQIQLRANDEPISPEVVKAGEGGVHLALDGQPLDLAQLVAKPNAYKVAHLPETFGVYVWYVPEVRKLSDDEMTPEMIEALRGLGYLE
jgi:arylsulfatase A-like enzyme